MAEEGAALLQAIAELQGQENSKLHLHLVHKYIRAYLHTVNLIKYQTPIFAKKIVTLCRNALKI